jgi:hypothetical protein
MNINNIHQKIEDLMEAYLANGLDKSEKAEFEAHIKTCENCKKSLEEAKKFEETVLQGIKTDASPKDLEKQVINSFRDIKKPKRRSPLLYLTRLAAIPAMLLLLIVIGANMLPALKKQRSSARDYLETPEDLRYNRKFKNISSLTKSIELKETAHKLDDGDLYTILGATDSKIQNYRGKIKHEKGKEAGGYYKLEESKKLQNKPRGEKQLSIKSNVRGGIQYEKRAKEKALKRLSLRQKDALKKSESKLKARRRYTPDKKRYDKAQSKGDPLSPNRKIIKTGLLTFEVESFETAYQKVVTIITEEKGYIASSDSTKLPNGKMRGQIIIRVLPERFDTVTLKLRSLGELKNQDIKSEDITKKYIDLEARLRNAQTLEARLTKLMSKKGKIKELLTVEREISYVRERVEKLKGEIKYYNNLTSLATITLDIMEKDIEKPFEYIQTQSANLSIVVSDVESAHSKAQTYMSSIKGQIIQGGIRKQNKRATGTITAYVDAEQFNGIIEQFKALGEVKHFNVSQQQSSSEGKPTKFKDTKIRKERGRINLTIYPPAGEYIKTQQGRIVLETSNVENIYNKAQNKANKTKTKILRGNIDRETDKVTATLVWRVEADYFHSLVDNLKNLGKVKSSEIKEHQTSYGIDPKSKIQAPVRKDPGTIELVIVSPSVIVSSEKGVLATLKNTLKGSIAGLLWSLERLIVGIATVLPWLVIITLVIMLGSWLWRRQRKK